MMDENTKHIVIDASFLLAWLLPDEQFPPLYQAYFENFALGTLTITSSVLLRFEIGNALRSLIVRQRATHETCTQLFGEFLKLPINYVEVQYPETLQLAIKHSLSFYDATYLHIALQQSLPLASLDQALTAIPTQ